MGGWLLFFCVSLTVLAPIVVFARGFSSAFDPGNMLDLVLAAFGLVVGGFVWNVHRSAFVLLWIYFALNGLVLVLAIAGHFTSESADNSEELVQLFRGVLSTVVWFLYFKKSDRVQATFGRNL